ncbi:MAG TPA: RagB/SusD family nutrient uptake outer membrane protein [Saprospiraceae bacterium]|nr:RagB/SusD family nutrient uptake outer membrane protein [Saprospiraceae bacterium]
MKNIQYKFLFKSALIGFLLIGSFNSCSLDDIADPNNPSVSSIETNATVSEMQNLLDGIQAGMRNEYGIYFDAVSVVGREIYRFSGSDPRFTGELLGSVTGNLDPGAFYTQNPYNARYRVVKNCNIMITAVKNTKAALTQEQKNGINGIVKTIKAHELLMAFNQQYDNGIRIQTEDPSKLGPFLDKNASLSGMIAILDDAASDLKAAGAGFALKLGRGFAGFDKPADFLKFNRALAARLNAYRENWDALNNSLAESFINENGDLNTGVYYIFSKSGGDLLNEIYFPPNATGEVRLAHPSFITDAEAGDSRINKATKRIAPASLVGLTSEYDFSLYTTNTDPISIIRNEELILLAAEYNIQKGLTLEAVRLINIIRNAANLPNYSGASDKDGLIKELLKQRRYALFGEGQRWIDMRRYNKLADLPLDRPDDDVWSKFPRPLSEQ